MSSSKTERLQSICERMCLSWFIRWIAPVKPPSTKTLLILKNSIRVSHLGSETSVRAFPTIIRPCYARVKATFVRLSFSKKPTFPSELHLTAENIMYSFSRPYQLSIVRTLSCSSSSVRHALSLPGRRIRTCSCHTCLTNDMRLFLVWEGGPVPLLLGFAVDEQKWIIPADKFVLILDSVGAFNLLIIVQGVGHLEEEGMHAVLSLKHLKERVPCGNQSSYHWVTTGNLALVHWAQLLVITDQDDLLGIHHGREGLNLTCLRGFIDDDFLKGDIL